jgi:acyl carrier protein
VWLGRKSGLFTQVTEIWRDVLKTDSVSIDDRFIECGGDSLQMVNLMLRINAAFGVELPVAVPLMEAPTPADLAAADWVRRSTPQGAHFLVGTTDWQLGTYRGIDGGYWLPLLAGRSSSDPEESKKLLHGKRPGVQSMRLESQRGILG